MIFEKLKAADARYREIEQMLTLPEVISDNKRYASLIKEYKHLEPIIEKYREDCAAENTIKDCEEIISTGGDRELVMLAEEELDLARDSAESLVGELRVLLMPRDPNDDRNVVVEIRQGAGGEEAALFGADLYRMYSMYATKRGFRLEVDNINETDQITMTF